MFKRVVFILMFACMPLVGASVAHAQSASPSNDQSRDANRPAKSPKQAQEARERALRLARQMAGQAAQPIAQVDQSLPGNTNRPVSPNASAGNARTPQQTAHPARPTQTDTAKPAGQRLASDDDRPLGDQAIAQQQARLKAQADAANRQPLGPISAPGGDGDPDGSSGSATFGPGMVLNTVTALGVIIGLILAGRWMYAKAGGRVAAHVGSGGPIEVMSRTAIAPKQNVLLLRVGQRVLVVSESSAGLRTLSEIDDPDTVADLLTHVQTSTPNSFSSSFTKLMGYAGRSESQLDDDPMLGGEQHEPTFDRARETVSSLLGKVRQVTRAGGAT